MKKTGFIVFLFILISMSGTVFFYEKNVNNQHEDRYNREQETASSPVQQQIFLSQKELIDKVKNYYDIRPDKQYEDNLGDKNLSVRKFLDKVNQLFREGWENRGFLEIDMLTQRFIASPEISRTEKVYALWSAAANAETNFQYRYFIDSLSSLSPVELTDEIVAGYYSTDSTERKVGLLRLMGTIPGAMNPSVQTEDQIQYINDQMAKVRSVIENDIQATDNSLLFEELVYLHPNFSPDSETVSLFKKLFNSKNLVLNKEEKLDIMVDVSFGTHKMQNAFIPQLLEEISSLGSEDTEADNIHHPSGERFVALLANAPKEGISTKVIPDIKKFIEEMEPNELEIVDEPMKYGNWVKSFLKYGDKLLEDEATAMTDFIFGLDDPVRAAALVSVANEEILLKTIHDERLPSFLDGLQSALQNQNSISASGHELIREELDMLLEIPIPEK